MQTTTERPARGAGTISRQQATLERKETKARQRVHKLREMASDQIERLIAFLDETDGYSGNELEDGNDAELSLGTLECFPGQGITGNVSCTDDREVEDEHDEDGNDREGDEEQHGGESEHEDDERGGDEEPSLGWTIEGRVHVSDGTDREADGSYVTEAARRRYKPFDRWGSPNCDGKHVDMQHSFSRRRLVNLSETQRAIIKPRLNRDEVSI